MFGHIERFFSTYWALFSSVWGYLGPIWGYVGPIWGYVGPMWAYLRLMLGLCWAYLDPFLAYIGPDQEFWPLLKNMQKHRILEQKWGPPAKVKVHAGTQKTPRHLWCGRIFAGDYLKSTNLWKSTWGICPWPLSLVVGPSPIPFFYSPVHQQKSDKSTVW
jgi:hypothetical protein